MQVDDALLTYSSEGTGIPCVLFIGGESGGRKLYSDELKRHIRFIHADAGHLTEQQLESLTLDDVINDIERVRKALGVEKIAVMGHSRFAIIPPEYGLTHPDHASHLILTGGRPEISEESDRVGEEYFEKEASEERKEILRRNREELPEGFVDNLSSSDDFAKWYNAEVPIFFRDAEFDAMRMFDGIELNAGFAARFMELVYGFDNTDRYHLIKAPVLVVAGRYDFWAPYYLWDKVKAITPDLTFLLLDNSGHNPMVEIQEEFDKKLIEWIDSH